MNTNDLPPAAKLAALIEAGRAANPDLKHGQCALLYDGAACAMGFACLAAGADRDDLRTGRHGASGYGLLYPMSPDLCWAVVCANDDGKPLDAIILSLREGELAKVCA